MLCQAIRRNAFAYADQVATSEGPAQQTWAIFADRVARAAAGLQALGLAPGDRVGILALNSARYLEAQFAIWWAGGVIVPMNTRWSTEENLYSARDAGIVFLLFDDAFAEMATALAEVQPAFRPVHLGERPGDGRITYDQLVHRGRPAPAHETAVGAMAAIYYTGGTTGLPKGVVLSHLALWSSAISLTPGLRMDARSRYLHAAPMFHLADGCMSLAATLLGAAHEFLPRFDPGPVIDTVEAKGVTHALLVPTMIGMLQASEAYAPERLRSLQVLAFGASPMPEPILARAQADLPRLALLHVYGQTEMGPVVTLLDPRHQRAGDRRATSVGKPVACVEVRIVDAAGRDVGPDVPGEILARGPNMMTAYWNKPEQTAQTLEGGWVHTGDVAYRDAEGFIYICDRAKDMIITGGENVFSAEVESVIAAHPAVAQVAVVGAPDDAYGERVHAVLVLRPGQDVTLDALKAHCAPMIAGYKHPRSMEVRDALPISGAGKVLKQDLRAPLWAGRARAVN